MKKQKPRMTSYYKAVHWLNSALILCNEIETVDPSIYENLRFELVDEEDRKKTIFQWFLTDMSEEDVEWMERSFGLLFTYSEKLELYVLCVDHCGTPWQGVECPCYNEDITDGQLESD